MTTLDNAPAATLGRHACRACTFIRKGLRLPYDVLAKIYTFIFARPAAQPFNNVILQLALRGQGYKNCCDPKASGEALLIERLVTRKPKLCIDVGANKGDYSKTLLSRTATDVIAFEPLPKAFQALSQLQTAYPGRFEAVNVAVGAHEEILQLHYGSDDSTLATFTAEARKIEYIGAQMAQVMEVPVITLDAYFEKHLRGAVHELDMLKIDTEGFEYEVLSGAQRTVAELRPAFIQIEFNWHQLFRGHSLRTLAELLPGYTPYQLLPYGSGLVKRDVNRPESNIYYYSNFVFVREGIAIH
jgi:FkbM family methyltransferase